MNKSDLPQWELEPDRVNRPEDQSPSLRALRLASRDAIELHRQHGVPMVYCVDGKVVEVMPDDVPEYRKRVHHDGLKWTWNDPADTIGVILEPKGQANGTNGSRPLTKGS